MTFIPMNLDEAVETQPVARGNYLCQITGAKVGESGENSKHPGSPLIKVTIGLPDEPNASVIQHYLSLPFEGDENAKFKTLMVKRFAVAFNVPLGDGGIDPEDFAREMIGQTATLEVTQREPNDNGDIFNEVKIPRLRGEEQQKAAGGGKRRRA